MATSAPRPTSFLTVSGVAATRGSPASISRGMAIFMMPPRGCRPPATGRRGSGSDEEIGHQDEQDDDENDAGLGEREKHPVGVLVLRIVIAGCCCVFDLAMVGHVRSPPCSGRVVFRRSTIFSENRYPLFGIMLCRFGA